MAKQEIKKKKSAKKVLASTTIRMSSIPQELFDKIVEAADQNERKLGKQCIVDLKKLYSIK